MAAERAHVDVPVVLDAARGFDGLADTLSEASRAILSRLVFDAAAAGRDHVAAGAAVRRANEALADGLTAWARAAREVADGLRSGAQLYANADRRVGAGIGSS